MNLKRINCFWTDIFVVSSGLQRMLAMNVHEDMYMKIRIAILEQIFMQVESVVFKYQTWDKVSLLCFGMLCFDFFGA